MGLAEHASIIKRLARRHRPRVVVEIGLKYSTTVLLPIFKQYGACRYIGIDPEKRYQCPSQFQDLFEYRQGLSVEVLRRITDFDFVMIDGDHNYYTVTQELNLLHQLIKPGTAILLHDVEDPWARKDLYYDRERIPSQWRDGPKQGVLTAVEDFLASHAGQYAPLKIFSGHNGLGYLVRGPDRRIRNPLRLWRAIETMVQKLRKKVSDNVWT